MDSKSDRLEMVGMATGTLCSTLYTHRERTQHDTYDNVAMVKLIKEYVWMLTCKSCTVRADLNGYWKVIMENETTIPYAACPTCNKTNNIIRKRWLTRIKK